MALLNEHECADAAAAAADDDDDDVDDDDYCYLITCDRAIASCRFAVTTSHVCSGFVLAFKYFSTLLLKSTLTPQSQFAVLAMHTI